MLTPCLQRRETNEYRLYQASWTSGQFTINTHQRFVFINRLLWSKLLPVSIVTSKLVELLSHIRSSFVSYYPLVISHLYLCSHFRLSSMKNRLCEDKQQLALSDIVALVVIMRSSPHEEGNFLKLILAPWSTISIGYWRMSWKIMTASVILTTPKTNNPVVCTNNPL